MGAVLITAVVQSSSFTTSLIITLAAAGIMKVETGIFAVMGANIGTSVTGIIVSLGQIHIRRQFRRATPHIKCVREMCDGIGRGACAHRVPASASRTGEPQRIHRSCVEYPAVALGEHHAFAQRVPQRRHMSLESLVRGSRHIVAPQDLGQNVGGDQLPCVETAVLG
jgi:hypothetical protein